jgi:hypothetical protein
LLEIPPLFASHLFESALAHLLVMAVVGSLAQYLVDFATLHLIALIQQVALVMIGFVIPFELNFQVVFQQGQVKALLHLQLPASVFVPVFPR